MRLGEAPREVGHAGAAENDGLGILGPLDLFRDPARGVAPRVFEGQHRDLARGRSGSRGRSA